MLFIVENLKIITHSIFCYGFQGFIVEDHGT